MQHSFSSWKESCWPTTDFISQQLFDFYPLKSQANLLLRWLNLSLMHLFNQVSGREQIGMKNPPPLNYALQQVSSPDFFLRFKGSHIYLPEIKERRIFPLGCWRKRRKKDTIRVLQPLPVFPPTFLRPSLKWPRFSVPYMQFTTFLDVEIHM